MPSVDRAINSIARRNIPARAGRAGSHVNDVGVGRRYSYRATLLDWARDLSAETDLASLLMIAALAIGSTAIATFLAEWLPDIGNIVRGFTWVVIIATTIGLGLSFTRLRALEGVGASQVGSVFLYLLVASIGAHAEFRRVVEAPALVAVGALWMLFHAVTILIMRRRLRAPIFFAAVGSQANVGGAASAPIVASAFHPALAPVGVLLAVGGYVLGTYAGLLCAALLELVHKLIS